MLCYAPNTRVTVHLPALHTANGVTRPVTVSKPGCVQFMHNNLFEQMYGWRKSPPVHQYCVRYDDGEVQKWVQGHWLTAGN